MDNLTRARKAVSYLESVEKRVGWLKESTLKDKQTTNVKFLLAELRNAQTLLKNMTFGSKPYIVKVREKAKPCSCHLCQVERHGHCHNCGLHHCDKHEVVHHG